MLKRALEHHQAGRLEEAAREYDAVLREKPNHREALYLRGTVAHQSGDEESAVALLRKAIASGANQQKCYNVLGLALGALGRIDEAVAAFERAMAMGGDPGVRANLGNLHRHQGDAHQQAGRFAEAINAYWRGLEVNPGDIQAWYACGCAEASREEPVAAVECLRKAVELDPNWAPALHNLGKNLFETGLVDEAIDCMRRAAETGPPEMSRAGIAVMIPGSPKSNNQAILEARQSFAENDLPRAPVRTYVRRGSRLRIGYVSSLFDRLHWMKPIWGLINRHDREHFEIHLFSDTPESSITEGYRRHAADRFHDITRLSNERAAAEIEAAGIDVLVDLNAYSRASRLAVYALRPAPVIVGWFNFFATSGLGSIDYLIGDAEVIPPGEEQFYTEKIIRVPGTYLTFEVTYPVPAVGDPPCLAKGRITFGSLATQYKLSPEVIAAWARILRGAPKSAIFLKNLALKSEGCRRYVRELFVREGIAPERVRLEGPSTHYDFLGRYEEIDLGLDPFPYSGGTTTSEAIWQGVPVISFSGDRWAARTSASIMRAAGLGEFVAPGLEEYVSLAVTLANDPATPGRLTELRRGMRDRLRASSACDMDGFARTMERIYREIAQPS